MHCPACGAKSEDAASYCANCGRGLTSATVTQPRRDPPFNYLAQAILVTIFCCGPLGIVAIVYAAQVNGNFAAGDYVGAAETARQAKKWTWISFGAGFVPRSLFVLFSIASIVL